MNENLSISSIAKDIKKMPGVHNLGITTPEQLDAYLKGKSVFIPKSLRSWWLELNGASLGWAVLYGAGPGRVGPDAIESYFSENTKYWERKLLPIGGNGGVDNYVLDLSQDRLRENPPVLYAEGSEDWIPGSIVASNLENFLWFVAHESGSPELRRKWPIDRGYVLENDPDIQKLGYHMFWDS